MNEDALFTNTVMANNVGNMTATEALNIPSASPPVQLPMPTRLPPRAMAAASTVTAATHWSGPDWPMGTSVGRASLVLGTSPGLFGKSVDMVDMCKQLMEAGGCDALSNIGSLRNELELPSQYAHHAEDDHYAEDLDDEVMILGTTPSFSSGKFDASVMDLMHAPPIQTGNLGIGKAHGAQEESDSDDDQLMGMSPDGMGFSPGFASYLTQPRR